MKKEFRRFKNCRLIIQKDILADRYIPLYVYYGESLREFICDDDLGDQEWAEYLKSIGFTTVNYFSNEDGEKGRIFAYKSRSFLVTYDTKNKCDRIFTIEDEIKKVLELKRNSRQSTIHDFVSGVRDGYIKMTCKDDQIHLKLTKSGEEWINEIIKKRNQNKKPTKKKKK